MIKAITKRLANLEAHQNKKPQSISLHAGKIQVAASERSAMIRFDVLSFTADEALTDARATLTGCRVMYAFPTSIDDDQVWTEKFRPKDEEKS